LLVDRFYLELKGAVFSELAEDWEGKWAFNVDEIEADFYEYVRTDRSS
jgi:hypothetical protein